MINKKVSFVVAGTQKGGTSALDYYLRQHTDICMADKKELHYFDNDNFFTEQDIDYSIYHKGFSPESAFQILGECTPIYMYWEPAPQRISKYNPDMKFIIILRNPIERAFSHWNMERSRGMETLSFWESITHEEQRCSEANPYQHRVYSYIDRGFYSTQLKRIWNYFPRNNVLLIRYENFKEEPEKVLIRICNFLSIAKMPKLHKKSIFSIPYENTMTLKEKEFLISLYENEIIIIQDLLNWDCSSWLDVNINFDSDL